MSVTVGVSYAAIATREKLRGGIRLTKVRRYWPGKAPAWAEEAEEDHENVKMQDKVHVLDLGFARNDDPRLRRLAQTRLENREQVRADHRRVRQAAEVISTKEEEEELRNQETRDEGEDEDALEERRRRRIRAKNLKRAREEADLLPVEEEEEEEELQEEEEEVSEYETDSEDEMLGITMFEPVFVPKSERDTVAERERLEAEEEALEELAKRKLETRKIETKQIVVEEVRKDEEIRKNMVLEEANIGDVETDDEIDEAEEYEAWKTREIARIKRDKYAKEAMLRDKEEIEKLRNMTEEERRDWERKNPKHSSSAQPKKKWKFMQRYYHKGAFFQEAGSDGTDVIFQRDFSAPTGEDRFEDRFDKSKLRKVLQFKNFGRSGRTKWTHLVNEDTTGKSNQWTSNDPLCRKYKRMADMDASFAKPKGNKKMKVWEY